MSLLTITARKHTSPTGHDYIRVTSRFGITSHPITADKDVKAAMRNACCIHLNQRRGNTTILGLVHDAYEADNMAAIFKSATYKAD